MTEVLHQCALQHPGQDHPVEILLLVNSVVAAPGRPGIKSWKIEHADTGDDTDKHRVEQLQRDQAGLLSSTVSPR